MIGETIGGYRIIEELPPGGMARVFVAQDEALGRRVALKVLHAHLVTDAEFLLRFHQEARAAATLDHPNIVTIYGCGEDRGQHYIAMQFVEGRDLAHVLAARGRLPEGEAAAIGVQVAEALTAAHRHGLVHRDIKPENVLLTPEGRVVVTDFGIARAADGTRLTKAGTTMGTPEYMSPEQVRGEQADARSDVYSLGIVLYEMVTGSPPFRAETPWGVATKQVNEQPAHPRVRAPDLSAPMESLILRCLVKQPGGRYRSAAELAGELRAVAGGRLPTSVSERPTRPVAQAAPEQGPQPKAQPGRPATRPTASQTAAQPHRATRRPRRSVVITAFVAVASLAALLIAFLVLAEERATKRASVREQSVAVDAGGQIQTQGVGAGALAGDSLSARPPQRGGLRTGAEPVGPSDRQRRPARPAGRNQTGRAGTRAVAGPDPSEGQERNPFSGPGVAGPEVPVGPTREPTILHGPPPVYPKDAMAKGLEGSVTLTVAIAEDGSVSSVTTARSSGHEELDRAAIQTIQQAWVFGGALKDGRPVPAKIDVTLAFHRGMTAAEAGPEQEAPEAKPIRLVGVTMGPPPVAVLKRGEERFFARVGDSVGAYRVQRIDEHEVVLAGPEGRLSLRLGR